MTKTKMSKPKHEIEMRSPESADADAIQAFAKDLPGHDLLYLRRDITKRPVVEAWLAGVADGSVQSLLAVSSGKIVGTSALVLDKKPWPPHVGEIGVLVGDAARGKGVGCLLIQETFALALESGLEKIIAQMTIDQAAARCL
jgi:N-acetylglutamate synthase-like GNAT family acetyltransferase